MKKKHKIGMPNANVSLVTFACYVQYRTGILNTKISNKYLMLYMETCTKFGPKTTCQTPLARFVVQIYMYQDSLVLP